METAHFVSWNSQHMEPGMSEQRFLKCARVERAKARAGEHSRPGCCFRRLAGNIERLWTHLRRERFFDVRSVRQVAGHYRPGAYAPQLRPRARALSPGSMNNLNPGSEQCHECS